jgi:PIN domain nuclease of toxin-antitoxin system
MSGDRLLLDTHTLIWWAEDSPRLPPATDSRIRHAAEALVSVASAWEIAIKTSLGRMAMPRALEDILSEAGFDLLPVTLAHTAEVARLPHHHRDPFDRMLIAQARAEGLALVSHDHMVRSYDVHVVWQDP